jgi:ABC-type cobalamin transport system permease subunit
VKTLGQVAGVSVLIMASLWVAAELLPRLLLPTTAIVGLVILTRLIFFLTRYDRWRDKGLDGSKLGTHNGNIGFHSWNHKDERRHDGEKTHKNN